MNSLSPRLSIAHIASDRPQHAICMRGIVRSRLRNSRASRIASRIFRRDADDAPTRYVLRFENKSRRSLRDIRGDNTGTNGHSLSPT